MINGNGGKCKSTANKYALSATDLPGEHLALMESGNTLIHSAGIINTQFLHDMDAVAMNRFMSNAEQGGNTLIIIVGNEPRQTCLHVHLAAAAMAGASVS